WSVRDEQVKVLRAMPPMTPDEVSRRAVRGQYGEGTVGDQFVRGYRAEPDVAPGSCTETYVALKLLIDDWRWQDVPFYLRTGKRLPTSASQVTIQFRPVPHQSFPPTAVLAWQPKIGRASCRERV